jgi:hypothetical protein
VVSSFNPNTRVITVSTTNVAYPRTNNMKVVAYFSFNPSYKVEVPFTITFEKCF